MDGAFLGLAGLLLRISLGLRPREIPRSSPASPRKTLAIPPILLGLTHYQCTTGYRGLKLFNVSAIPATPDVLWRTFWNMLKYFFSDQS